MQQSMCSTTRRRQWPDLRVTCGHDAGTTRPICRSARLRRLGNPPVGDLDLRGDRRAQDAVLDLVGARAFSYRPPIARVVVEAERSALALPRRLRKTLRLAEGCEARCEGRIEDGVEEPAQARGDRLVA